MIDIGTLIKEEIENQDRTISWLARKLNRNRAAVYRLLRKNSIDTQTLSEISRLLHRDFFIELSKDIFADDISEK